MQVAVATDSTAYVPPDLIEPRRMHVVRLYVVCGGNRTVPEAEITDYPAFSEELRAAETLPTTPQPSIGDFVSAYEPLLASGRDIVSVHISGGLSGTPEAARQAAEALAREGRGGERVRVIDSLTAAGGLAMMALAAASAAACDASLEEVEERVAEARGQFKMWFAMETLEFLKRGGRIGAASAWIGSTLRVKPILTVASELTPVERVRTSSRAFERLLDYARQRHQSGADAWAVQHISAPDEAERLSERCGEIFGREPLFVSEIGAVLSAHTGPGLLGVGAIPERLVS